MIVIEYSAESPIFTLLKLFFAGVTVNPTRWASQAPVSKEQQRAIRQTTVIYNNFIFITFPIFYAITKHFTVFLKFTR